MNRVDFFTYATMSSSHEESDSDSDLEDEFYNNALFDNGSNAFAFEPEYTAKRNRGTNESVPR